MKRLLLMIIAIISMVNTYATGFETIGGLRYLIDTDAKTATLVASDGEKYSGDIVVPEEVKLAGIDYTIVAFGDNCFKDCQSLTSVNIPSSVTSLGNNCFTNCKAIKAINIPSSVISLGEKCFSYSGISSINIPPSVTNLGAGCFSDCNSLDSIFIPSSVTSIGEECFQWCHSLRSIVLPSTITVLEDNCFWDCSSLKSINIPNSVTKLGFRSFCGCKSLTSIIIPSSVTSIGGACFSNCDSLTSIALPSSLTSLGYDCFSDCAKLDTVYCYAETPPYCSSLGFLSSTIIYVPATSIEMYRQDPSWKEFKFFLPIPSTETNTKGKCEKPSITFADGKLHFESSTTGAYYHYTLTCNDAATDAYSEDGNVTLKAAYNISAYATADGYSTSDKATATLYWIDGKLDDPTGISSTTSAKRGIVVSSQNGNVTLSGLNDGEKVTFYSTSGSNLGSVKANHGVATSSFPQGQVIIAKVGKDSLKVAL